MASQLEKGCINKETGFLLQASRSDAKKSLFHKALNSPVVLAVMDKAKEIAIKSKHIDVNFQRFPTLDAKKLVNAPKMSAHHRGICHF